MAPGLDGLPAAEREVEVAAPVSAFLTSLSPRVLTRIKLGLRAFELLPFPWRFSRLQLGAREDFLRRMEESRLSLYHELLLMGKVFSTLGYAVAPEVEERIGTRVECRLADGSLPEPAGPLGDTTPTGDTEECDVVIVGSGAGGAVAAATLAEAGLDVIVLEAGEAYDRDSYPTDPLEAVASLYRDGGLTIAEGRPPIPVPVARTVGGTTVINSAPASARPNRSLPTGASASAFPGRTNLARPTPLPRTSSASTPSTPSAWAATGSWRWRARPHSAPPAARSPATPATVSSAAPAPTAARSTPSAACTSATYRAPSR